MQGQPAKLDLALPASAVAQGPKRNGEVLVEGRLLLDLTPDAERVGVLFQLPPGWHLYWRNPGEVGLPTELAWYSAAALIGEVEWPSPQRFSDPTSGLVSYGYEEQVLLASPFQLVADTPDVPQVSVEVHLLVCQTECIPAALNLSRPVSASTSAAQLELERSLFDRYRERIPVAPERLGLALRARYSRSAIRPGDPFEALLSIDGCNALDTACATHHRVARDADMIFYSDLEVFEAMELDLAQTSSRVGSGELLLRGELASDLAEPLERLSGVLSYRSEAGELRSLEVDLAFPYAPAGAASQELTIAGLAAAPSQPPPSSADRDTARGTHTDRSSNEAPLGILRVLLLALIGGLLLNAMPCVLPVLGIKVCSAAELAQHDPRELRLHGLAYAGGVFSSMAALSAVVLALRAAGTQVGWGFQFQEPVFVAVVASVVVLFAMNLFGLFEIQISTGSLDRLGGRSSAITRSFFDGLLCVVLATPCTAPFLGTAVGFAFAGGGLVIATVFLAIGAGLAAPYVAICWIPRWARFVPRPGNWMLRLRSGLGFLLLGTAVWLIWIFGRSAGVDGTVGLLSLLVVLAFGSWLLGWVQSLALPRASIAAACTLLVCSLAGLNLLNVDASRAANARGSQTGAEGWAAYDREAIERTLQASHPVFVSFTADWCITCKVNERVTLADARVERALDELGFRTFRGDWTERDEAIRAELARHGRAGVPLYLVYDPRTPSQPTVLPELLRVESVLESLREAAQGLPGAS